MTALPRVGSVVWSHSSLVSVFHGNTTQYLKSVFTSGVCGDSSLIVDDFRCNRYEGKNQEAELAENQSFCYLGDPLDGDGGADLAATVLRAFPFLTSRSSPLEMKGHLLQKNIHISHTPLIPHTIHYTLPLHISCVRHST